MSEIELEVKNLTKKYGDFTALDNVSFKMNKGIYAVMGLNGAGKSTLINLITDNIKRTSGTILYNDKEILQQGNAYRDKIGYMPQEQGFYNEFTARSYLRYIAVLKGIKRKVIKNRINELLKQFNLEDVCDKKMGKYSGGMRQRAIMAQALLNDPEIVILDEPTAGLDPKERYRLKEYIKKISDDKIVIYCTHIVSDIENIADYVMLMKDGKIIKMCNVKELYDDIASQEVGNDLEKAFMYYMQ